MMRSIFSSPLADDSPTDRIASSSTPPYSDFWSALRISEGLVVASCGL